MYNYRKRKPSLISKTVEREFIKGQTIEQVVERLKSDKEPIKGLDSPIYTERDAGVQPAYDVRTDRFEIAADLIAESHKKQAEAAAKSGNVGKVVDIDNDGNGDDFGGAESVAGTTD